jgi:hypothetical protein
MQPAEAEAALAALPRSLMERDSAILRLIYTFEAGWKSNERLAGSRRPASTLARGVVPAGNRRH